MAYMIRKKPKHIPRNEIIANYDHERDLKPWNILTKGEMTDDDTGQVYSLER
jgi:hypothetical protein